MKTFWVVMIGEDATSIYSRHLEMLTSYNEQDHASAPNKKISSPKHQVSRLRNLDAEQWVFKPLWASGLHEGFTLHAGFQIPLQETLFQVAWDGNVLKKRKQTKRKHNTENTPFLQWFIFANASKG